MKCQIVYALDNDDKTQPAHSLHHEADHLDGVFFTDRD